MCLEYVNQLSDEQLKEIYKLYLNDGEKILALNIDREDDKITLRGKIEISYLNAIPDEKISSSLRKEHINFQKIHV